MSVIYVLLPVAILFAIGALVLFIRAVRSGQYDDLDTPAVRMLHDDEQSGDVSQTGVSGTPSTRPARPGRAVSRRDSSNDEDRAP